MVARLGIKHIHTSACHPAANGVVEKLVRPSWDIIIKLASSLMSIVCTYGMNANPQVPMAYIPITEPLGVYLALLKCCMFATYAGCPIGVQLSSQCC
jgi:transposase InsO family protein